MSEKKAFAIRLIDTAIEGAVCGTVFPSLDFPPPVSPEADMTALLGDWHTVGSDLRKAIDDQKKATADRE